MLKKSRGLTNVVMNRRDICEESVRGLGHSDYGVKNPAKCKLNRVV